MLRRAIECIVKYAALFCIIFFLSNYSSAIISSNVHEYQKNKNSAILDDKTQDLRKKAALKYKSKTLRKMAARDDKTKSLNKSLIQHKSKASKKIATKGDKTKPLKKSRTHDKKKKFSMSLEYFAAINDMQNDSNKESSHKSISGSYAVRLDYKINDMFSVFSRYMRAGTNTVKYVSSGKILTYSYRYEYANSESTHAMMLGGVMNIYSNCDTRINLYGELGIAHSRFTSIYSETTTYPNPPQHSRINVVKHSKVAKGAGIELLQSFGKQKEAYLSFGVFDNGAREYNVLGKNTVISTNLSLQKANIGLTYLAGTGLRYYF